MENENFELWGRTRFTVHWDCLDQLIPMLQMIKTVCKNDVGCGDTYQDVLA
jgi:hypothetical protein